MSMDIYPFLRVRFMKLFKSLLLAPATLGLLVPLSAQASDIVNVEEMNGYVRSTKNSTRIDSKTFINEVSEDIANLKSRVDGLEVKQNEFEAGGFSETTVASFKVIMAAGAVDGKGVTSTVTDGNEDVDFAYSFQTKLKTSFSGEDSLSLAIDSGSLVKGASGGSAVGEFAGIDETSDQLKIDGVAYKFPLGDNVTVLVGDGLDASKQFTTACAYGGPSDTLDDCGNVNANVDNGGAHLSFEYDFGNGLTTAVGYAGDNTGLGTKGNKDAYGANLAYSADNYGISATYGVQEDSDGNNDVYTAVNGYYSFDNGLNVSAGYETGVLDNASSDDNDETEAYFVGINGEVGAGELGAAFGTYGSMIEANAKMPDRMMYEVYYDYPVNDGMTITPLIYTIEGEDAADEDETGMMVKTTFKF